MHFNVLIFIIADTYRRSLVGAIQALETENPEKIGWITLLGWNEIEVENMRRQQEILREHYKMTRYFKSRIDKMATAFLENSNARPIEARLPIIVPYLLDEIPMYVNGLEYQVKVVKEFVNI